MKVEMEIIRTCALAFILIDWIYMNVKYKEWNPRFTLYLIATTLFITAAMYWRGTWT